MKNISQYFASLDQTFWSNLFFDNFFKDFFEKVRSAYFLWLRNLMEVSIFNTFAFWDKIYWLANSLVVN